MSNPVENALTKLLDECPRNQHRGKVHDTSTCGYCIPLTEQHRSRVLMHVTPTVTRPLCIDSDELRRIFGIGPREWIERRGGQPSIGQRRYDDVSGR